MVINGDTRGGIFDESKNRQSLTSSGASMSSAITPLFSSQCIETSTNTDYIYWSNKVAAASATEPMTVEMFVQFAYNSTAANWQQFANEITSTSAPSIGDWAFTWYDTLALRRFTGSGLTQNRAYITMSFTADTWYHIFGQDNGDGTMTIGYGTPFTSSTGTGTSVATGQISNQTPTEARYAVGPGARYNTSLRGFYFQRFVYTKGAALYPSSGTYKIPPFRKGG
jgi:hypothetical protein